MTPAPSLMISRVYPSPISRVPGSHAYTENSEPVGPYVSVPTYQPPYAAHPTYGPTLTPTGAPVTRGISLPQYPPATGAPFEPPVQSRAGHPVARNPRSHGRQPLVSQEMDAPQPKRRDWRCHPHFKHSLCSGRRKALCVSVSALALLVDVEQGYR